MSDRKLQKLLDDAVERYNRPDFIESDPIQIPHRYAKKEDIEIAGFLASTIAWGQRKTIINNAKRLMDWMDDSPHDFIINHSPRDLKRFEPFVHRTFNSDDCITYLSVLQHIYRDHGGLEPVLLDAFQRESTLPGSGWNQFKAFFFSFSHLPRTRKHLPDPLNGSAAKRMNMYLRWMVRADSCGVDFGIWKSWSAANLYIPLDVHTSNVGRKLGLLERKQNDWKSVVELTNRLKEFDPADPIKYDFALFGLGAFEKF